MAATVWLTACGAGPQVQPGGAGTGAPVSPGSQSVLRGVACISSTWCTAVGSSNSTASPSAQHAIVESWNGVSWALVVTPQSPRESELRSIACASRTWCMAVGALGTSGDRSQRLLVDAWDGTRWTEMQAPNPASPSSLQAVTCVSRDFCIAVGSATGASGLPSLLIERWNGSAWSVSAAPAPPGAAEGELNSVACNSATSCHAVGSFNVTGDFEDQVNATLVETWDGTTWRVVPSPSGGVVINTLVGVACPSAGACIAVGNYSPGGDPYTSNLHSLVETDAAGSWQLVPSGTAATGSVLASILLQSVACVTAAQCVAVGYTNAGAGALNHSLVDRWDGATWITTSQGAITGELDSVACPSATWCLAVGSRSSAGSPFAQAAAVTLR